MAPQVDGILGATAHILVDGDRVAHHTVLGGLHGGRVAKAAVVEGDHVIAKCAQHLVQFDAVIGKARVGVAVQIENHLGARLLERALEELRLVGGVYWAEIGEVKVFDGRQVVGWNRFFEQAIGDGLCREIN